MRTIPRRWLLPAIAILLTPAVVSAQVVINEIAAFELTDHEWIEIYNTGGAAIDLTGWKFWENGTNHGLASQQGDLTITAGEYAIIAQKGDIFLSDHAGFGGTVIDSSWGTLKESGEEIGLKDAGGNLVELFTYLAAPATALERTNAALADYTAANWQPHLSGSTPGLPNSNAGAVTIPAPDPEPTPATTENLQTPATEIPPTTETIPAAADPLPQTQVFGRQVFINEFLSNPEAGGEEWVELYNVGSLPAKLDGWKLMEGAGSKRTLSGILAAGAFLVVSPSGSLNDAGDHIVLLDDDNIVVNEISYGDWDDGNKNNNAPAAEENIAVARRQDGRSTGSDASDFSVTATATPGQPNRITAIAAPPPASPPPPPQQPPAATPTPSPRPSAAHSPAPTPAVTPTPTPAGGTNTTLTFDPTPPTPEEQARGLPSPTPKPSPRPRVQGSERVVTIAAVKQQKPDSSATVVGIVIALPGQLGKQIFYLADDTGGLQIYQHQSSFPELTLGATVEVEGKTSLVRGEPRLKAANAAAIRVLATGEPPAAPAVKISELTAGISGTLVSFTGEVTAADGTNFTFDDGSGEIAVALWHDASAEALPFVGARGSITGILTGADDHRQLRMRAPDDLRVDTPEAALGAPPLGTDGQKVNASTAKRWDYRYTGATIVASALATAGWLWNNGRRKNRPPPADKKNLV